MLPASIQVLILGVGALMRIPGGKVMQDTPVLHKVTRENNCLEKNDLLK